MEGGKEASGGDRLAGRVENAAERYVPGDEPDTLVAAEHWSRYRLASRLAKGARVLDAGCGVGYGSALLAGSGATDVLGLDLSEAAVKEAQRTAPANARFREADLRAIPEPDDSFDLIACFEVIEHLEEQEAVLDELTRVLAPGGILLVSSPNRDVYLAGNPHHVRELTPDELLEMLQPRFENVRLLRQQAWTASAITDDEAFRAEDPYAAVAGAEVAKVEGEAPGRETFTLALATNGPLPETGAEVVLARATDLHAYMEAIKALEARVSEAEATAVSASDERRAAIDERDLARREVEASELSIAELQRNLDRANAAITDITGSLSWRLTAPLRRLRGRRVGPEVRQEIRQEGRQGQEEKPRQGPQLRLRSRAVPATDRVGQAAGVDPRHRCAHRGPLRGSRRRR